MSLSSLDNSPKADELLNIDSSSITSLEHLTFPDLNESNLVSTPPSGTSQPRQLLKDRLYVGNLHPTVDEYTLIQVFSKFGKIAKMDFLFHKSGPLKGKPRGYAFVEYVEPANAASALDRANNKLLRGRKLVVTYAHQAPLDQAGNAASYELRRRAAAAAEANKPTTLSLLKSHSSGIRGNGTADKIALMEAKLQELEGSSANAASGPSPLSHPSLPRKPPPTIPGAVAPTVTQRATPTLSRSSSTPTPAPTKATNMPAQGLQIRATSSASAPRKATSKLTGVRITKITKSSGREDS